MIDFIFNIFFYVVFIGFQAFVVSAGVYLLFFGRSEERIQWRDQRAIYVFIFIVSYALILTLYKTGILLG